MLILLLVSLEDHQNGVPTPRRHTHMFVFQALAFIFLATN